MAINLMDLEFNSGDMREHFENQLKHRAKLTADAIKCLNCHPLYYDSYEPGDKLLVFMDQSQEDSDSFTMVICVERDFDKMEKDYKFIRLSKNNFPVLKRKWDVTEVENE